MSDSESTTEQQSKRARISDVGDFDEKNENLNEAKMKIRDELDQNAKMSDSESTTQQQSKGGRISDDGDFDEKNENLNGAKMKIQDELDQNAKMSDSESTTQQQSKGGRISDDGDFDEKNENLNGAKMKIQDELDQNAKMSDSESTTQQQSKRARISDDGDFDEKNENLNGAKMKIQDELDQNAKMSDSESTTQQQSKRARISDDGDFDEKNENLNGAKMKIQDESDQNGMMSDSESETEQQSKKARLSDDGDSDWTPSKMYSPKKENLKEAKMDIVDEFDQEGEMPRSGLSEYEMQIKKNIELKNNFLASINMLKVKEDLLELKPQSTSKKKEPRRSTSKKKEPRRVARRSKPKSPPEPQELRRSLRQRKLTAFGGRLVLTDGKHVKRSNSSDLKRPPPPGSSPIIECNKHSNKEKIRELSRDISNMACRRGGSESLWSRSMTSIDDIRRNLPVFKMKRNMASGKIPNVDRVNVGPIITPINEVSEGSHGHLHGSAPIIECNKATNKEEFCDLSKDTSNMACQRGGSESVQSGSMTRIDGIRRNFPIFNMKRNMASGRIPNIDRANVGPIITPNNEISEGSHGHLHGSSPIIECNKPTNKEEFPELSIDIWNKACQRGGSESVRSGSMTRIDDIRWNPPVFKLKRNMASRRIPNLDWANVGPIITPNNEVGEGSHGRLHGLPSASQKLPYNVFSVKDISRKFPLQKSMNFAYPLSHPQLFPKERRFLEKENFYYRQGGNSLDVVEYGGEMFVLYPAFYFKRDISISKLTERSFGKEEMDECGKEFYCLQDHSRLALRSKNCQQLIAKNVNNTVCVISRNMNSLQLFELDSNLRKCCDVFVNTFEKGNKGTQISSVALSDTLPFNFVTACVGGSVSLYNATIDASCSKPIWEHQFPGEQKCVFQCDFGNHISSLVVNNRFSVWHCDTRVKSPTQNSTASRTLFTVKELQNFIPDRDIICKVARSQFHHLNLITSNAVLLMDERYCKTPVMKWEHSLSSFPSFTTRQTVKGYDFLTFGNCKDFKLCSVYQDLERNQACSSLTGLPSHFDFVRDTVQFAHHHNLWFSSSISRLSNKVIGLGSCVNPKNDSSMLLFSLNDNSDVFLQDLQVCRDKIDDSFSATCDEVGEKLLREWEEKCEEISVIESVNKSSKIENTKTPTKKTPVELFNVSQFYENLENSLLNPEDDFEERKGKWSVQNYIVNNFTEHNNLSVFKEDVLQNSEGLAKYLPCDFLNHIESKYVENCDDILSKALLKVWQKKVEEGEASFKYHRAPFNTKNLSTLPKKLKLKYNKRSDGFYAADSASPEVSQSSSNLSSILQPSDRLSSIPQSFNKLSSTPQPFNKLSSSPIPNMLPSTDQNSFCLTSAPQSSSKCLFVSPNTEKSFSPRQSSEKKKKKKKRKKKILPPSDKLSSIPQSFNMQSSAPQPLNKLPSSPIPNMLPSTPQNSFCLQSTLQSSSKCFFASPNTEKSFSSSQTSEKKKRNKKILQPSDRLSSVPQSFNKQSSTPLPLNKVSPSPIPFILPSTRQNSFCLRSTPQSSSKCLFGSPNSTPQNSSKCLFASPNTEKSFSPRQTSEKKKKKKKWYKKILQPSDKLSSIPQSFNKQSSTPQPLNKLPSSPIPNMLPSTPQNSFCLQSTPQSSSKCSFASPNTEKSFNPRQTSEKRKKKKKRKKKILPPSDRLSSIPQSFNKQSSTPQPFNKLSSSPIPNMLPSTDQNSFCLTSAPQSSSKCLFASPNTEKSFSPRQSSEKKKKKRNKKILQPSDRHSSIPQSFNKQSSTPQPLNKLSSSPIPNMLPSTPQNSFCLKSTPQSSSKCSFASPNTEKSFSSSQTSEKNKKKKKRKKKILQPSDRLSSIPQSFNKQSSTPQPLNKLPSSPIPNMLPSTRQNSVCLRSTPQSSSKCSFTSPNTETSFSPRQTSEKKKRNKKILQPSDRLSSTPQSFNKQSSTPQPLNKVSSSPIPFMLPSTRQNSFCLRSTPQSSSKCLFASPNTEKSFSPRQTSEKKKKKKKWYKKILQPSDRLSSIPQSFNKQSSTPQPLNKLSSSPIPNMLPSTPQNSVCLQSTPQSSSKCSFASPNTEKSFSPRQTSEKKKRKRNKKIDGV